MADRRRPHTSASSARHTGSIASRYLDLRPLPEDVLLDVNATFSSSFDTKGSEGLGVAWKEEEEQIRKQLRDRLPSSNQATQGPGDDRPATAPQLGQKHKVDKEKLGTETPSLRNARYLAIQWRSRATQLNVSNSLRKTDTPPSLKESDSGSDDSDSDDESVESDFSSGSVDESIQSQVSDAQKVVEKWKLRFADSRSVCSSTASRDEEEEDDRYDPASSDEFHFAMRPSTAERALLTNEEDEIELLSALKPYPLQPVNSGLEFLSESQQQLQIEEDEDEEQEPMEDTVGVFVSTEGGRVMETLIESPDQIDKETNSVGNHRSSHSFHEAADRPSSALENDGMISVSRCSSQDDDGNDDHLSLQSNPTPSNEDDNVSLDIPNASSMLSYGTNQSSVQGNPKSRIQTFCDVPEPMTQTQSQSSQATLDTPTTLETKDPPPSSENEKIQDKKSEEAFVRRSAPKVSAPKVEKKYTGTVQERIEAVKRAKAAEAAKLKAAKPSSSKSKKAKSVKSRSSHAKKTNVSTAATSTSPKTESTPVRWIEHNVVFTFGLLTAENSAPPAGAYNKEDEEAASYKKRLKTRSRLLHDILKSFRDIIQRTKSLSDGSTKYIMISPDSIPIPIKVKRDEKFQAPRERPRIKRSVVRAVVPIFVPNGDERAKEIATHVIIDLFSMAISRGEFDGQKFEKVS